MTRFTRSCCAALVLGLIWGGIAYVQAEDKTEEGEGIVRPFTYTVNTPTLQAWTQTIGIQIRAESMKNLVLFFQGKEPQEGHCYGLKAQYVGKEQWGSNVIANLQFIEQPCWTPGDCNAAVCVSTEANGQKSCMAGWCLEKKEE